MDGSRLFRLSVVNSFMIKFYNMFWRGALLIISSSFLQSCGGGGDSGGNFIPTVQLECATAGVAGCSQNGKTAWVGLIESLAADCDDTLATLASNQRQQLFNVNGSVVSSQAGAYLTGRVSSWTNSTGGEQDVLNPGTYQVCAFVDLNGNDVIDTNEPVGQGQVSIGGSGTFILSNWAAAFN